MEGYCIQSTAFLFSREKQNDFNQYLTAYVGNFWVLRVGFWLNLYAPSQNHPLPKSNDV